MIDVFSTKLARSRRNSRNHTRVLAPAQPRSSQLASATPRKSAELSRVVNNCRAICSSIHVPSAIRALIENFSPFFLARHPFLGTIYILLSFNVTLSPPGAPLSSPMSSLRRGRALDPTFSIFQLGIFPIDLRPSRRGAGKY